MLLSVADDKYTWYPFQSCERASRIVARRILNTGGLPRGM
jgi:hypothetical protein